MEQFIDDLQQYVIKQAAYERKNTHTQKICVEYSAKIKGEKETDKELQKHIRHTYKELNELDRELAKRNVNKLFDTLQQTAQYKYGFSFVKNSKNTTTISHIRVESLYSFKLFFTELEERDPNTHRIIREWYRYSINILDNRGENATKETFKYILGDLRRSSDYIDTAINLATQNTMIVAILGANAFNFIKYLSKETLADHANGAMAAIYSSIVILEEIKMPYEMRCKYSDFKDRYNEWVIELEGNDKFTLSYGGGERIDDYMKD